jgi:hypothetical protein
MKHVVSISLGSSTRDKAIEAEFAGLPFEVKRIGTDGSLRRAIELIHSYDGHADCIGLGGINRYLVAAGRRYAIREAERMARAAVMTPVVDGGGLKRTLEPRVVRQLDADGTLPLAGRKVLLVSGVDRFGLAACLPELGAQVIYGDLIFALGLPIPIRSRKALDRIGRMLLPLLCRLPISVLYPTGKKQETADTRYARFFEWADVIAGDFHFMRRHLPAALSGKAIVTNTTTQEDVDLLRERGLDLLVTTTIALGGRSFATNVMEGVIVALAGKRPEDLRESDYIDWIDRLGWGPRVLHL